MDNKITVWTKQHESILNILEKEGRYITKREYIEKKFGAISTFYLDIYTWYTGKACKIVEKPDDVKYPIWVSLSEETRLNNDSDTVILEIAIEKSHVITFDIEKWDYIANYLYIPSDAKDEAAHQKLLDTYGVDDPTAYMSGFYPAIKNKIVKSWDRLFENSHYNSLSIGTIWEVKREWVLNVIR